MNAKTKAAVRAHGEDLKRIFPKCDLDPVELCRKLRKLEREGEALGLRLCNGPELDEDEADRITERILDSVDKLLNFRASGVPVFVNRDPRGYALKIKSEWMEYAALVTHDGKLKYCGPNAHEWIHRNTSFSVDHATKHEGYAIERLYLHHDWGGYGILAPDLSR